LKISEELDARLKVSNTAHDRALLSRVKGLEAYAENTRVSLIVEEGARADVVRDCESLKSAIREIYAIRGEDPEVAVICNRALVR
jgi:hypothetical protein